MDWLNVFCLLYVIFLAETGKFINYYAFKPSGRSCTSNLIPNLDAFNLLKRAPPIELTERYYECVMTPYDSAFEALGLSMGNADLFTATGTMVILLFVSMWLRSVHNYKDNVFDAPAVDVSSFIYSIDVF